MTQEEFIAKAVEHAKRLGIAVGSLQKVELKEVALVHFRNPHSSASAELYLDNTTGDVISATYSGLEFEPKGDGKSFSKDAQIVLALASIESRRQDRDFVASEHLLIAALAYGEGAGSTVLSDAGLSPQAVRSQVTAVGSTPEKAPHGYGPSMLNVLRASSKHAEALCNAEIQPEHLILGLLDESYGGAIKALRHFGVDAGEVKQLLLQRISNQSR